MEWISPFIVYRISDKHKLEEVYHASSLKDAKYWLTYIAKPGDVLCTTPVCSKHSHSSSKPEYVQHKERSGQAASDESQWQKIAKASGVEPEFPVEQALVPVDV